MCHCPKVERQIRRLLNEYSERRPALTSLRRGRDCTDGNEPGLRMRCDTRVAFTTWQLILPDQHLCFTVGAFKNYTKHDMAPAKPGTSLRQAAAQGRAC